MDKELLEDLKQFITVTISQQTASLRADLRNDIREDIRNDLEREFDSIRKDIARLDEKVDDIAISISEVMHASNFLRV